MFENFLPKAILLSLTLHTAFLCGSFLIRLSHNKHVKKEGRVEISYRPAPKQPVDVREHPVKPAQQIDLQGSPLLNRGALPMRLASKRQGLARALNTSKPRAQLLRSSAIAQRVLITPITSPKINNPAYAAYSEMVRSRIREKVYENYSTRERGSVYLTFVLSSDGVLKAALIIHEKSQASQNLKDISMNSLQQSQFPPVLKGMALPEYTYNIEIQYQVRD